MKLVEMQSREPMNSRPCEITRDFGFANFDQCVPVVTRSINCL